MDEPVNSLVGEKIWAHIKVNRKTNRPNWPAPPFNSIFNPGEPPYIQLDPIYYGKVLSSIFDQLSKLHFGFNVLLEIQILKVI